MKGWQKRVSDKCDEVFRRHGAKLTLGGEPTFLPVHPQGPEWSYSAVGPTKLGYAKAVAACLLKGPLRGGVALFSPGKSYPGEVNPRWAIRILANRDGSPVFRLRSKKPPSSGSLAAFRNAVAAGLEVLPMWKLLPDPLDRKNRVWAIVLGENKGRWRAHKWPEGQLALTTAQGPAGLRLPLHTLAKSAPRRALTIEWNQDGLSIFLPPVFQKPFLHLLRVVEAALISAGIGRVDMQGYLPEDETRSWIQLGLAADPGVLEVNLPACSDWSEYARWIEAVTKAAAASGLRPWKQPPGAPPEGTGGGNHLLFGGPSIEENPFFSRPDWLASILRHWQRHPSLAYLFTGCYAGASSQAPRADESARDLHDLEMALSFLESLPAGDHRAMISETLRHLQTDVTGNSHRSEVSLDKFWNPGWPAGTLGLLEFRAIESLPKADWMSAVALLWTSLAARLLEHPERAGLRRFASALHDRYFLPSILWNDLYEVLKDLADHEFRLDPQIYRNIWNWKFPKLLDFQGGTARAEVRKAHENWPLLCETPVDGGTTSRFVDTSMQRLEVSANPDFAANYEVRFNNRPLRLVPVGDDLFIAGLRYRRTNLYPSLHPGLPPQIPLHLDIIRMGRAARFTLGASRYRFRAAGSQPAGPAGPPCKAGNNGDLTCDLRIP